MDADSENTLAGFNRCFYPRPVDFEQFPAMRTFEERKVITEVMEQCNGLQECQPFVSVNNLSGPDTQNWDQLLFIQVACEQDNEMVELKNILGLCCTCIGFLVFAFFRQTLFRDYALNAINDKILDSNLITLGDYSVKGKISRE